MKTLIFDIETVGERWEDLDEVTQTGLLRWVEHSGRSVEEKSALKVDVMSSLGFSPLTGVIVALGLYDLERQSGVVYFTGSGAEIDEVVGDYVYKQRSEAEMISEFWDGARHYDTFVTFNGRRFDLPFLLHRSVANSVKPTKNLLEGRYPYQQKSCRHVDLQDELTFFGAMQRRPSLHMFCRAFDIPSPKTDVCGDNVAELFQQKKFRDIAHYNAQDVVATTALYKKWRDYFGYQNNKPDDLGEINY